MPREKADRRDETSLIKNLAGQRLKAARSQEEPDPCPRRVRGEVR